MERRPQSLQGSINAVRLYLDDVETIVEAMREAGEGEVTITTKDHVLRELGQLEGYGEGPLGDLEIRRHSPHVSLHLKDSGVWIYASEDDAVSTGVYHKVLQVVLNRRLLVGRLFPTNWWAIIVVVLVGNGSTVLAGVGVPIAVAVAPVAAAALWWLGVGYFHLYRGALFIPARKRDAPSFLRRNKDLLVVGLLCAVVGALVAWGLSELFGGPPSSDDPRPSS